MRPRDARSLKLCEQGRARFTSAAWMLGTQVLPRKSVLEHSPLAFTQAGPAVTVWIKAYECVLTFPDATLHDSSPRLRQDSAETVLWTAHSKGTAECGTTLEVPPHSQQAPLEMRRKRPGMHCRQRKNSSSQPERVRAPLGVLRPPFSDVFLRLLEFQGSIVSLEETQRK